MPDVMLEPQDMTVDETIETRLERLYDERDHYRDSVSVERAQRQAAEALLAHATRFVFGHYAAMNFYAGFDDFPTRWAVYRMKAKPKPGSRWRLLAHTKEGGRFAPESEGTSDELVVDDWLHVEHMGGRTWSVILGHCMLAITVGKDGKHLVTMTEGRVDEEGIVTCP